MVNKSENVSIYTIAEALDISASTVSRALKGSNKVSQAVKNKVFQASREIGFMPKTRNFAIGIILEHLEHFSPLEYSSVVLSMLARKLTSLKIHLEIIGIDNLDWISSPNINCVLALVPTSDISRLLEIPHPRIISINNVIEHEDVHNIFSDHRKGVYLAARHLLSQGHQKIGFIEHERNNWGSRERLLGYQDSLHESDLAVEETLIAYSSEKSLHNIVHDFLMSGCTAILNFSDPDYLELVHVLQNIFSLKIPEDISLVSGESCPIFSSLTPPITSVTQSFTEMVNEVVKIVSDGELLSGPSQNSCFPQVFVDRHSVKRI